MSRSSRRVPRAAFRALAAIAAMLALAVAWESYKAMGEATGGTWPGTNWSLPVATDDGVMPHVFYVDGMCAHEQTLCDRHAERPPRTMLSVLWEPVQRGSDQSLALFLAKSAAVTLGEAARGFALGVLIGVALAVFMLRFRAAERALLPWINISQTIPLIALAPLVVLWGRDTFLSERWAVALIATYLTFFPVAVNVLKGLQSPDPAHVELMRSYAAPWRSTLWMLRFPAARPYLFPALKLAATLSVVGSIVGEISAGVKGGLGRVILDFAGKYTTGPARLYAAVFAAALLGLFVFAVVSAAERAAMRGQMERVS